MISHLSSLFPPPPLLPVAALPKNTNHPLFHPLSFLLLQIYVGCAGGGITKLALNCKKEELPDSYTPALLSVGGLVGGHSGADIHKYRASAIKVIARVLDNLVGDGCCRLADVSAGDKHNVIPRESEASIFIQSNSIEAIRAVIGNVEKELLLEYGVCEKTMSIKLEPLEKSGTPKLALTPDCEKKVLALLNLIPHGPIKFSHSIPELVETSNNIASVKSTPTENGAEFVVTCSTRSSVNGAIEAVRRQFRALAGLCNATVTGNKPYPGWQPNLDSKVLKCTMEEVTKLIGFKPEVTAIHAGLECGIIGERLGSPPCDMVAFGPTIIDAHSPAERVQISTVEPFWKLVLNIVQNIAKSS